MKIGLLDFGEIGIGSNCISTIYESVELVKEAERLGFSRYWIAEHHEDTIAFRNLEIITTLLSGYTESIRIGTAGILLPLHSPLQVAQKYMLLNNLFDDRIDLGLAKGITEEKKSAQLSDFSNLPTNISNHHDRFLKVKSFLDNNVDGITLIPSNGKVPKMWFLTTSDRNIEFISNNKLKFSLSLFHNLKEIPSPKIIYETKKQFYNKNGYYPEFNIAISVYINDNENEIETMKRTRNNIAINIACGKKEFKSKLEEFIDPYETEEVIIVNLGKDFTEKKLIINELSELL